MLSSSYFAKGLLTVKEEGRCLAFSDHSSTIINRYSQRVAVIPSEFLSLQPIYRAPNHSGWRTYRRAGTV